MGLTLRTTQHVMYCTRTWDLSFQCYDDIECGLYATDFSSDRYETVGSFLWWDTFTPSFSTYPNFHRRLKHYKCTSNRALFESYKRDIRCGQKVFQRGSPFWATPRLAGNAMSCCKALSAGLGLTLLRPQDDWNTRQTLDIPHIWYVQRENGLHAMVLTSNASPVTGICRALCVFHPSAWGTEVQNLPRQNFRLHAHSSLNINM